MSKSHFVGSRLDNIQTVSQFSVVPVFNVDGRPFSLLCGYTADRSKHFLEGYEMQFMRAIGVIILSAVLKRRMLLADKAKSLFISK